MSFKVTLFFTVFNLGDRTSLRLSNLYALNKISFPVLSIFKAP